MFKDRQEAGKLLAQRLQHFAHREDVVLLALPRGGVPVAYEIAQALDVPMDVFLVRKIGVPGHEELAMGAIAEGGFRVINQDVVRTLQITDSDIEDVTHREQIELERRAARYRGDRPGIAIRGNTAILVDDGLATGASMRVAARAMKSHDPAYSVVAVPVAPPDTCEALENEVDEVVCAVTPEPFGSVGAWYEYFEQVSDSEVEELLDEAYRATGSGARRKS
jgi:putative phosphoribosyl transferase